MAAGAAGRGGGQLKSDWREFSMRHHSAFSWLIIAGIDPGVFIRFPKPGNGVARLE